MEPACLACKVEEKISSSLLQFVLGFKELILDVNDAPAFAAAGAAALLQTSFYITVEGQNPVP